MIDLLYRISVLFLCLVCVVFWLAVLAALWVM